MRLAWVIAPARAQRSMAVFTARSKTASPIKSWGIGALSVVAMTTALLMRSHSGWGYAAGAAELCELIFGGVAVLLLVLIGLGQAGLTRLFRRKRAAMPTATAARANAPTPTSDPRHE